jgi:hypothetical protein
MALGMTDMPAIDNPRYSQHTHVNQSNKGLVIVHGIYVVCGERLPVPEGNSRFEMDQGFSSECVWYTECTDNDKGKTSAMDLLARMDENSGLGIILKAAVHNPIFSSRKFDWKKIDRTICRETSSDFSILSYLSHMINVIQNKFDHVWRG